MNSNRIIRPELPHQQASQLSCPDDVTLQNFNFDDFNVLLNDHEEDDESDSDSEKITENSFEKELVIWAKQFLITTTEMDALLKLLKTRGHPLLPKSSKTLYQTPVSRDLVVV